MRDRLESIHKRYMELEQLLADIEVISDLKRLETYAREHASLAETNEAYLQYKSVVEQLAETKEMQSDKSDPELREMAKLEADELSKQKAELEARIKILLLPKDPNDNKNVIVEIRAAAGGEEAALFAAVLYRMYVRYTERQNWQVEMLEVSETGIGGFKEVIFSIQGKGAYSRLKYESGAHRVQRIPTTESGGRIHTSTATVAVLPEAEEVEIEIHDKDIRIDTFCSSGPGGQSVNTTKSAVRITHLPTGIMVSCQDGKSQNSNKDQAMRVLRARLFDRKQQEELAKQAEARKSAIGTGDRSERIRTYNFPQSRVTDHRIGLTLHKLEQITDGDLQEIIETLTNWAQTELLQQKQD